MRCLVEGKEEGHLLPEVVERQPPPGRLLDVGCLPPMSGSFLPPSPPRDPPSQVVIVTASFQSFVDPPFMCVFTV